MELATVVADKKRCACGGCKKKLSLSDFDCRCGMRFCGIHRAPETHACNFNFAAAGKALLVTALQKVGGNRGLDERA